MLYEVLMMALCSIGGLQYCFLPFYSIIRCQCRLTR